jgi:hypothetical protein
MGFEVLAAGVIANNFPLYFGRIGVRHDRRGVN